jgi:hypothetical protein
MPNGQSPVRAATSTRTFSNPCHGATKCSPSRAGSHLSVGVRSCTPSAAPGRSATVTSLPRWASASSSL